MNGDGGEDYRRLDPLRCFTDVSLGETGFTLRGIVAFSCDDRRDESDTPPPMEIDDVQRDFGYDPL